MTNGQKTSVYQVTWLDKVKKKEKKETSAKLINIWTAGHLKRFSLSFFFVKETLNPPLKAAAGSVYLIRGSNVAPISLLRPYDSV